MDAVADVSAADASRNIGRILNRKWRVYSKTSFHYLDVGGFGNNEQKVDSGSSGLVSTISAQIFPLFSPAGIAITPSTAFSLQQ